MGRALSMTSVTSISWGVYNLNYSSSPQDFVVTEIDSSGRLVQLDRFSPPPSPPPPPPGHTPRSLSVPTTCTSTDDEITTEEPCAAAPSSASSESGAEMSEDLLLNELL